MWSALEEACRVLGPDLDLDNLIILLEETVFPPGEMVDVALRKTGCAGWGKIRGMGKQQRPTSPTDSFASLINRINDNPSL